MEEESEDVLSPPSPLQKILHIPSESESIETKCKDLVFTFFFLSKQSALFGG